jgi:predicted molibdopterin-dependent oxidoreductase YjgC
MVTGRSPQGTVFIPFHFAEAAANVLTNDRLDPRAKIPDFKMCAVRLEKTSRPPGHDAEADQPLIGRGAIKDQAVLVH